MDRSAIPREKLIEEIRRFMHRIGVQDAIFFGSRERGDEHPHSDLNLVLLDERFTDRRLSRLLSELQRAWKMDVQIEMLPCSPDEFEEMQGWNSLAREAAERGLRIHIDMSDDEET